MEKHISSKTDSGSSPDAHGSIIRFDLGSITITRDAMSRIKQFCMESYVDNILLYHSHGIFTHRVLINERRGLLQTSVSKWIIGDRGISVKLVTSADRKTTVVMTPAELLKNRRKYYIPKKSKKHDEFQTLGIRMTKTEIRKISELARVKGYKTRSEFIRSFINSELALAGL